MVSLISTVVSWLKGRQTPTFSHMYDLPWPNVMHQILEEDLVKDFKEVFVIGDVHGCYDELIDLLNTAEVADDSTLKLFVGNVIGKGPKSQEVFKLLKASKSMLTVRGNQEELALKQHFDRLLIVNSDNEWILDLSAEDRGYLVELPYTISIPTLNAVVVHAGIIPGIPMEHNNPKDLVTMRDLIFEDYFGDGGIKATKSHDQGYAWASLWHGPQHIYFGHDAKRMLQQETFTTGLDTACLYGKNLTGLFISGPRAGTFIQIKAKRKYKYTNKFHSTICSFDAFKCRPTDSTNWSISMKRPLRPRRRNNVITTLFRLFRIF